MLLAASSADASMHAVDIPSNSLPAKTPVNNDPTSPVWRFLLLVARFYPHVPIIRDVFISDILISCQEASLSLSSDDISLNNSLSLFL